MFWLHVARSTLHVVCQSNELLVSRLPVSLFGAFSTDGSEQMASASFEKPIAKL